MMCRPVVLALLVAAAPVAAQERPVPYWASIAAGEALMRSGPERGYPAVWLYRRRDLPVRVLQVEGAWRRVQERDGTTGWMLATLLSAQRTAIVAGTLRPIHAEPSSSARLLWQAEPGVIGRVAKCDGTWCQIQIGAKRGFVEQAGLWGLAPGERVE